ncbi:MAG: hypothetical protein VKS61_16435 [Candidatus Sericytochromatia bacterium]|nr:hypothetical protein [Candidatus Sericytochromatia bacterium]
MAASLATPLIAPGITLPLGTALAAGAGGFLAWRAGLTPPGQRPTAWALGLLGALVVAVAALAWASFGAGRAWAPATGALGGAGLALVAGVLAAPQGLGTRLAVLLLGAAGVGAAALTLPPGVDLANALLGGMAAHALGRLLLDATGASAAGAGEVGTLGLLAGLVAWGDRLVADGTLGAPLAVWWGLALASAAAVAVRGVPRHPGPAAAGLVAVVAWLLMGGLLHLPTAWWGCAALGAAVGVALALGLAVQGSWERLARVVAVAAAGLLMVLDSRLAGIVGVALGGLGLACVAAALPASHRARSWLALTAAIFATRVWLQLFLDRVALTGYGVDLTHPYATAALLAGALFPALLAASTRAWWGRPPAAGAALAVSGAAPALIGYFLHLEALGAWLMGLVAAMFVGVLAEGRGEEADEAPGLMPSVLVAQVAVSLLAAPWLVTVMNVTRGERLVALAGLTVAVAATIALAWPRQAASPPPAAG